MNVSKPQFKWVALGAIIGLLFLIIANCVVGIANCVVGYYEMTSFVQKNYDQAIQPYREIYSKASGDKLQKLWFTVKQYFRTYRPMWNTTTHKCDGRPVSIYTNIFFYLDPPTTYYRYNFIKRYGCCEEIASSICALVLDVSGLKTRVVNFKGPGLDHAIPEVYYNDSWWVFDVSWTTEDRPVKASDYYPLVSHNYTKVACATIIQDAHTFQDLRAEHGFPEKLDPELCGSVTVK